MGASSSQHLQPEVDVLENKHNILPISKLLHSWLDNPVDSVSNDILNIQRQIQESLGSIKLHIFEDEIDCEGFVRDQSLIDKVIIIVNEVMADFFVPRAHKLCQVACILIYYQTEDLRSEHHFEFSTESFRKVSSF